MIITKFSINELKEEIRDTIRAYLYPSNTVTDTYYTLSSDTDVYNVAQEFTPYSKCYTTTSPYRYTIPIDVKIGKVGTPDDNVIVSLQSYSNGNPSGTTVGSYTINVADVSTSMDVYTGSIKLTSMLGSNTKYYVVVEPQCSASTINYYVTEKSSLTTYLVGSLLVDQGSGWSTLDGALYFNVHVPNFVYSDYPRNELSKYSFPRVSLDFIGRKNEQRWINTELADYVIDFTIVAYSNYSDELDDVLSIADRAIFIERTNFYNVIRIDPDELTPVEVLRDNLFTRALRYKLTFRMTNQ